MENLTIDNLPKAVYQLYKKLEQIERILLQKNDQEQPDQLLTIQQAAKFLSLSVPTLYGYVSKANIPVCKRGGRLYFSKLDLTNWVKEGRKLSNNEVEENPEKYLIKKNRGK